jgi:hypothetical protein
MRKFGNQCSNMALTWSLSSIPIAVFWDVTPCILVDCYKRFRENVASFISRLHGATYHQAMRTSKLTSISGHFASLKLGPEHRLQRQPNNQFLCHKNAIHLLYKDKITKYLGKNHCLFWETHDTHSYTVWENTRILNPEVGGTFPAEAKDLSLFHRVQTGSEAH